MWAGNATILVLNTILYLILAIAVFFSNWSVLLTANLILRGLTPLMFTIVCGFLGVTYH